MNLQHDEQIEMLEPPDEPVCRSSPVTDNPRGMARTDESSTTRTLSTIPERRNDCLLNNQENPTETESEDTPGFSWRVDKLHIFLALSLMITLSLLVTFLGVCGVMVITYWDLIFALDEMANPNLTTAKPIHHTVFDPSQVINRTVFNKEN